MSHQRRQLKGVPEWIDGLADSWARDIRGFLARSDSIQGTLGRIHEEGPVGAAIKAYRKSEPNVDFGDSEVRKFHRAWLDLDVLPRRFVWVHYVEWPSVKKKCEFLGVGTEKYYSSLKDAINKMAAEFHLYD